jgi:hypothetical protein
MEGLGKHAADTSGLLVFLAWFGGNLPAIVTLLGGLLSVAWYVVRFYDRFVLKKGSVQE